jgi:hypothetical protein
MIPYKDDFVKNSRDLNEAITIAKEFKFEPIRVLTGDIRIKQDKIHIQNQPFNVSRSGIINLCDALKIPDPFAERIPTDLFITNVNRLSEENKEKQIDVYFLNDDILIDSNYRTYYEPIPNLTMLELISEFKDKLDFSKCRFMFENHRLKIEIAGNSEFEIKRKGDIHNIGAMIQHYPTNKSLTLGNYILWTVACTNGALLPNDFGREKLLNKTGRNIQVSMKSFINKLLKFVINKENLGKLIDELKESKFNANDLYKLYKRLGRLTDKETAYECMGKGFDESMVKQAEKFIEEEKNDELINHIKYNAFYAITDYGSNKVMTASLSKKLQRIGGEILLGRS